MILFRCDKCGGEFRVLGSLDYVYSYLFHTEVHTGLFDPTEKPTLCFRCEPEKSAKQLFKERKEVKKNG